MTETRIAVTGIGATSAAGDSASALGAALDIAKPNFLCNRRFDLAFEVSVAEASIPELPMGALSELDSPTGRFCLQAAAECVRDGRSRGAASPDGLVLGTSTGGQSNNEEMIFALLEGRPTGPFDYRLAGCMASPARLVARGLDIKGPVQTVSTACTSSAAAIAMGASWIATGRARRVLAGGGDALCRTTLTAFKTLELTGPQHCRPFAADRPGLTLGEGAGFVLLERLDVVVEQGRTPRAVLLGYGMSSDAHHMTAPPPDGSGAELAMRRALDRAGLSSTQVDHISAHGTGTTLNDAAEAQAIARLFGDRVPVMSCKGVIGHTLGGAGGLEAVASVLSLETRRAFPHPGATDPGPDCPISLTPPDGLELPENATVLSNSFAFGGNNCVLVFGAFGKGGHHV